MQWSEAQVQWPGEAQVHWTREAQAQGISEAQVRGTSEAHMQWTSEAHIQWTSEAQVQWTHKAQVQWTNEAQHNVFQLNNKAVYAQLGNTAGPQCCDQLRQTSIVPSFLKPNLSQPLVWHSLHWACAIALFESENTIVQLPSLHQIIPMSEVRTFKKCWTNCMSALKNMPRT